ncbi:hypothetical protein KUCAC02_002682 [Chaenocephalus aceratus]|uniref:Uncharacterized protein n=1 Tax=Chaenocephalus aceratus TaxID=36190 RepID=A0ACB9XWW2_CHAAC|nr:hypothetical protein KUCAC02_002682 [Chaenocephalus aceratus]
MAMCEVCNCRQVLSAEMMCFYSAVLLCFGMAINHGLQSTAKRHLLLSASLVVGRDYSQNKVQTAGAPPADRGEDTETRVREEIQGKTRQGMGCRRGSCLCPLQSAGDDSSEQRVTTLEPDLDAAHSQTTE